MTHTSAPMNTTMATHAFSRSGPIVCAGSMRMFSNQKRANVYSTT